MMESSIDDITCHKKSSIWKFTQRIHVVQIEQLMLAILTFLLALVCPQSVALLSLLCVAHYLQEAQCFSVSPRGLKSLSNYTSPKHGL